MAVLTGEYSPFKMAFARDNCCSDNEMDGTPVTECMWVVLLYLLALILIPGLFSIAKNLRRTGLTPKQK